MNLTLKENILSYSRPELREVGSGETGLRLCTGKVTASAAFILTDLLRSSKIPSDKSRIGLIVQWNGNRAERHAGVLSLEDFCDFERFFVRIETSPFNDSYAQYVAALSVAGQPNTMADSFRVNKNYLHIAAGDVEPSTSLEMEVAINTDSCRLIHVLRRLAENAWEASKKERKSVQRAFPPTEQKFLGSAFRIVARTIVDLAGAPKAVVFDITLVLSLRVILPVAETAIRPLSLNIHFGDSVFLKQYPGHAAMDVGNSGSTLAVIDGSNGRLVHIDRENRRVLADDRRKAQNLNSAVYYEKLASGTPRSLEERLFPASLTVCGEAAQIQAAVKKDQRSLVISPKRYLERPFDQQIDVKGHQVSCHLPLRNLMSGILKEAHYDRGHLFHQGILQGKHVLPSMTLTYPSTFIKPEIDRLEGLYFSAVEDISCRCNRSNEPPVTMPPIVRPEMLDEATAASFYFLSRDYFESDCRVAGFEFLYPTGANILVMDFGGGTTDVALVRCVAKRTKSVGSSTANHPIKHCIEMEVLGRTGLRQFGGDVITMAVYRVLKATVAEKLGGETFLSDAGNTSFLEWYERECSKIDEIIPTRTRIPKADKDASGLDEMQLTDVQRQTRQSLASEFWAWAEKVKIWLSEHGRAERTNEDLSITWPHPPGGGDSGTSLYSLLRSDSDTGYGGMAVQPGGAATEHWSISELPCLMQTRYCYVEEQIRPLLELLLKKANGLIDGKIEDVYQQLVLKGQHDPESPMELHRAYVVGQAAHFPLIRDVIASNLHIEKINHDYRAKEADWAAQDDPDVRRLMRLVFDRKELKNSVVRGALAFSCIKHTLTDVDFLRDENLKDKLPFDILFDSHRHNRIVVYEEGERFDHFAGKERPVGDVTIEAPIPGQPQSGTVFRLYRRWPGDPDEVVPEEMFRIPVDPGIIGRVWIRYVAQKNGYFGFELLIGSDKDPKVVRGHWITSNDYESPLQRGDL